VGKVEEAVAGAAEAALMPASDNAARAPLFLMKYLRLFGIMIDIESSDRLTEVNQFQSMNVGRMSCNEAVFLRGYFTIAMAIPSIFLSPMEGMIVAMTLGSDASTLFNRCTPLTASSVESASSTCPSRMTLSKISSVPGRDNCNAHWKYSA
jgi:hypothetical protein